MASAVSAGAGPSGWTAPAASAPCTTSLGMSAQIVTPRSARPSSRAISRTMSSVQATCGAAPAPPAEPMMTGIPSALPARNSGARSFFVAERLTLGLPVPSLLGPASVEPASIAIACGSRRRPSASDTSS